MDHSNTIKVLEKGDLLSLNYNNNVTEQASVGVFVAAGYDTSAFHNPHSCLPSSGNRIFEDKEIKMKLNGRQANATYFSAENDTGSMMVIYWYEVGNTTLPGNEDIRTVGRDTRLMFLKNALLNPFKMKTVVGKLQERQIIWYRFIMYGDGSQQDKQKLNDFIYKFMEKVDKTKKEVID